MKDAYLAYVMDQKVGKDIVIFTLTCLSANKVCLLLRKLGHKAVTVNGQMSQSKRLGSLARFRQRDANILVATDVAGRGIHIDGISHVVNYALPEDAEDFVHRIGRTGRAGNSGIAISFACEDDAFQLPAIEELLEEKLTCVQPEEWMLKKIQ